MTKPFPYILKNNVIISENESDINLNHAGFLYGYGVFESLLIDNKIINQKKPCFFDEHIARLRRSAAFINLSLLEPVDPHILRKNIMTLIEKNNITHASLNIYYTAGKREVGKAPFDFPKPELFAVCRPYIPNPNPKPIKVGLVHTKYERTPLDAHKTLNYMKPILDRQERPDCDEVIIVNKKGEVLEASTANVFLVKGKTLITPEDGVILPGVMRDYVCGIASRLGLLVEKRKVMVKELATCDEVFLTNALKGIMEVGFLDERQVLKSHRVAQLITETIS